MAKSETPYTEGDRTDELCGEAVHLLLHCVPRSLFPLHRNYRTHAPLSLPRHPPSLSRSLSLAPGSNKHLSSPVRLPLPVPPLSLSFSMPFPYLSPSVSLLSLSLPSVLAGRARYIFAMHNITASAAASMSLFAVAMHDGRYILACCLRVRARVAGLPPPARPVVNRESVTVPCDSRDAVRPLSLALVLVGQEEEARRQPVEDGRP